MKLERDDKKTDLKHECELTIDEREYNLADVLTKGAFLGLKRKIIQQFLISMSNPMSMKKMRSHFVFQKEKIRHLKYHFYMFHPFSNIRAFWEVLMSIVFICLFTLIPLERYLYSFWLMMTELVLEILNFLDVLITFNTGYIDYNTDKVILGRYLVARHYLLRWFFFDLLSCFNHNLLFRYDQNWVPYIVFLKAPRTHTLFVYIKNIAKYRHMSNDGVRTFILILCLSFVLLWTTCLFASGYQSAQQKMEWFSFKTIKRIYANLMLIGEFSKNQIIEVVLLEMITLIIGFLMELYILWQLSIIFRNRSHTFSKLHQIMKEAKDYLTYKKAPDPICRRVLALLDFKYQQKLFAEQEIFRCLSDELTKEVLIHTQVQIVENAYIFKDLPMNILYQIIYMMKMEVFLPTDVVLTAGTLGDEMFFLNHGAVAIYSMNGKEICHLHDGSSFGEIAMVFEMERRNASAIAIDYCEFLILKRGDFHRILDNYPEVLEKIRVQVLERVKKIINAEPLQDEPSEISESSLDQSVVSDVLL